jgi:malic enzyme
MELPRASPEVHIVGKEDRKVVVSGVGASGSACVKILQSAGMKNIIGLDSKGIVHPEREDSSSWSAGSPRTPIRRD